MAVIVFASSKGGAGKTTACVVLACEFARQGRANDIAVSLVDADPNQHSAEWAKLEGAPENIRLFENVDESSMLDVIEQAQMQTPFVLVDLEGVASNAVVGAVSRADLVIIPCQASQNDAKEAVKTIKTVNNVARILRRDISFSVLFTRLSAAIITRTGKVLAAEFDGAGVDIFECALIDREAFRSIFSFGGAVHNLDADNKGARQGIEKASENARQYAEEVKRRLWAAMETDQPRQEVAANV